MEASATLAVIDSLNNLVPGKMIMSAEKRTHDKQSWPKKFWTAWTGLVLAFREHNSFYVHVPVAVIVIGTGLYLQLGHVEFCLLLICVGAVLTAELFNTSIEYLAKAVTTEDNEQIRMALDVASSAVLLASLFAALVGGVVIWHGFGWSW